MKVYYVATDWTIDCENSKDFELFEKLEDAQKRYLEEKEEAIKEGNNWSETNSYGEEIDKFVDILEGGFEEGDASYSVQEDGRYIENHIDVVMGYKEVQ